MVTENNPKMTSDKLLEKDICVNGFSWYSNLDNAPKIGVANNLKNGIQSVETPYQCDDQSVESKFVEITLEKMRIYYVAKSIAVLHLIIMNQYANCKATS